MLTNGGVPSEIVCQYNEKGQENQETECRSLEIVLGISIFISVERFQSISKARLSAAQKLLRKKYREESGKFLVEGVRSVAEAVASEWKIEMLAITREFSSSAVGQALIHEALRNGILVFTIRTTDLQKISDTEHSQGVVAVVQKKSFAPAVEEDSRSPDIIVALDGLSDPGNLGTIIRACDWFGVGAVLISKKSVELFNPKVVRSTMGSLFHLPIFSDVDFHSTLEGLKERGYAMWAAAVEKGRDVSSVLPPSKVVVVIGSESHGLSSDVLMLADERVSIPRFGQAESLNAAVACGILLSVLRLRSS